MEKLKITSNLILFFDLDGTLIDTDYANFLSYKNAVELVKKDNINLLFTPTQRFNRSVLKTVIPTLTEKELETIVAEKEKCYTDYLHKTILNKSTSAILCKYTRTNKTVLVTNCREDRALATLNYHGLTEKFGNLFFRQFDGNAKVNKFKNAIQSLSVSPDSVVVFENEDTEIADAKEIGIKYINPIIELS